MSIGATMEDKQAMYLLTCRDKVHSALLTGQKSSIELYKISGLTPEETANAIYALKTDNYLETTGLGEYRLHGLTTHGKLNAPPPPIPDFQSKECAPRTTKPVPKGKNKIKFSGQRHYHGVPGKFPTDHDGVVMLNLENNIGRIWAKLETSKSTIDLRNLFPDMPDKTLTNTIYFLRKMGLIEKTKGKHDKHSLHTRTNIKARLITDIPEKKVTYKDIPVPVTETPIPVVIKQTAIQQDLKVLYQRHSKSDLITELALDLAEELEALKILRQQMKAISH